MNKVVVTGIGVLTGIGTNQEENLASLQRSVSGIGLARHFQSRYSKLLPVSEIAWSDEQLKALLPDTDTSQYTRTCLISLVAAKQAVEDAGLSPGELRSFDTALISASTVGGMCITDQLYSDANRSSAGSPYLETYSAGAHTLRIARHFGIRGFTDTINTACSSSANAIMMGFRLINQGIVKRAIVGGVDSLAKYTVNGFNALRILSETPCQPFDENRTGLNLGEGAAYLVLENADYCRSKKCYAEVMGYGNSNDAFHPTALSDEAYGIVTAIRKALQKAHLTPEQIDYVNAHGTGTENNDSSELHGLTSVFGKAVPPFSSTKSYTGHTLGAAGAVEAVYSILSLVNNQIYPTLSTNKPISPSLLTGTEVSTPARPMKYVLSNSFGFGGSCTSLVFGRL